MSISNLGTKLSKMALQSPYVRLNVYWPRVSGSQPFDGLRT